MTTIAAKVITLALEANYDDYFSAAQTIEERVLVEAIFNEPVLAYLITLNVDISRVTIEYVPGSINAIIRGLEPIEANAITTSTSTTKVTFNVNGTIIPLVCVDCTIEAIDCPTEGVRIEAATPAVCADLCAARTECDYAVYNNLWTLKCALLGGPVRSCSDQVHGTAVYAKDESCWSLGVYNNSECTPTRADLQASDSTPDKKLYRYAVLFEQASTLDNMSGSIVDCEFNFETYHNLSGTLYLVLRNPTGDVLVGTTMKSTVDNRVTAHVVRSAVLDHRLRARFTMGERNDIWVGLVLTKDTEFVVNGSIIAETLILISDSPAVGEFVSVDVDTTHFSRQILTAASYAYETPECVDNGPSGLDFIIIISLSIGGAVLTMAIAYALYRYITRHRRQNKKFQD